MSFLNVWVVLTRCMDTIPVKVDLRAHKSQKRKMTRSCSEISNILHAIQIHYAHKYGYIIQWKCQFNNTWELSLNIKIRCLHTFDKCCIKLFINTSCIQNRSIDWQMYYTTIVFLIHQYDTPYRYRKFLISVFKLFTTSQTKWIWYDDPFITDLFSRADWSLWWWRHDLQYVDYCDHYCGNKFDVPHTNRSLSVRCCPNYHRCRTICHRCCSIRHRS